MKAKPSKLDDGHGGKRAAAGRPTGGIAKISAIAREKAMATGLLPHEWLLSVARGEPIPHKRWDILLDENDIEISRTLVEEVFFADFNTRVDAAKAAAPFYAPKLATQTVTVGGDSPEELGAVLKILAEKLPL